MVKIVAEEKGLNNGKRESATMYVEDLAEYTRVLLATTKMTFEIGWLRIQLILFCQLAGITGNRPEALVELRFRHLNLTLIRDLSGRPRLFIELTTEYTKGYLGMKDAYVQSLFAHTDLYPPTLLTRSEATYSQSQKSSTTPRLCSALMSSCSVCYSRSGPSSLLASSLPRSYIALAS